MDERIGRSLFDPTIRLPAFVLRETALAHDIALLAEFCRSHGVSFAPHGKTTMAPAIFRRQAEAGAWAITVATPWQAEAAVDAGIERTLSANEVFDDAGLAWIGELLDRDGPELLVCADSVAGVRRMAARLRGVVGGCPCSSRSVAGARTASAPRTRPRPSRARSTPPMP
jgi:D-serine deaminase-like pyridoxal phosphate-dependent protein